MNPRLRLSNADDRPLPGLLAYTKPGEAAPKGSFVNKFNLFRLTQGSQLVFSTPALGFNNSISWFSCAIGGRNALNGT